MHKRLMHLTAQAQNRRHPLRNFLMHGFHMLVMLVVGNAVRDTQCGFKVSPTLMASRMSQSSLCRSTCWMAIAWGLISFRRLPRVLA